MAGDRYFIVKYRINGAENIKARASPEYMSTNIKSNGLILIKIRP
jgi:hypothetical protein